MRWRSPTTRPSCSSLAATTLCARCGTGGRYERTGRSPSDSWPAIGMASRSSTARYTRLEVNPCAERSSSSRLECQCETVLAFFIILSSPLCQGDARYLISNSKDQSIKLWDVRKFSPKEGLAASRLAVTQQNWDYRWQQVPQRGEEGDGGRLKEARRDGS